MATEEKNLVHFGCNFFILDVQLLRNAQILKETKPKKKF